MASKVSRIKAFRDVKDNVARARELLARYELGELPQTTEEWNELLKRIE